ncbi:MAG: 4-(cytidine 5'-diphospho)-2-C-methyl-D-erythritol kinase [Bacillota bacterium]|nr:4-(cytidine 5'-diphospho)-2-C-methyl-D-erythritol kinase [Bacillota bacterium]
MILQAPAKINLTLDVVGKREDGYHNVKMIMETVSLYDTVTVFKRKNIEVKCNLPYVPTDERNIAYRAAVGFFESTGIEGGAYINIVKRIPVAAGLAGGSTDGAAVLKGLNRIYGNVLTYKQLIEVAAKVGADVPYCLNGRMALAEGIGEILTPIKNLPKTIVLLAKPPISLSTKLVYSMIKWDEIKLHPDTEGALSAIEREDINGLSARMYNVLEEVSCEKYPIIKEIKLKMLEGGALGSIMSGSGPTVFGLYDSEEKANKTMEELKSMCQFVYVGHTL